MYSMVHSFGVDAPEEIQAAARFLIRRKSEDRGARAVFGNQLRGVAGFGENHDAFMCSSSAAWQIARRWPR